MYLLSKYLLNNIAAKYNILKGNQSYALAIVLTFKSKAFQIISLKIFFVNSRRPQWRVERKLLTQP